jgi:hypothetical protein
MPELPEVAALAAFLTAHAGYAISLSGHAARAMVRFGATGKTNLWPSKAVCWSVLY